MRHRGDVADHGDFQPDGLERANGRLASGTRAFDAHFDFLEAMAHRLTAGILGCHLRRVRGALA